MTGCKNCFLFIIAFAIALLWGAIGHAQPLGKYEFLDGTSTPVVATEGEVGKFKGKVQVVNNGNEGDKFELSFFPSKADGSGSVSVVKIGTVTTVSDSCNDKEPKKPCASQLPARKAGLVEFEVEKAHAPLSGYLVLTTYAKDTSKTPTAIGRQLKIFAPPINFWVWLSLGAGALLGIGIIHGVKIELGSSGIPMNALMGSANWDWSKSWVTNISGVGTILASSAAIGLLPEATLYLQRASYSALSVLLTALALMAPLLYQAARSSVVEPGKQPNEPVLKGTVGNFLLASGITIAAAISQLFLYLLLMAEISAAALAPMPFVAVVVIVDLMVMACILTYARQVLRHTAITVTQPRQDVSARRGAEVAPDPTARQGSDPSTWAPL